MDFDQDTMTHSQVDGPSIPSLEAGAATSGVKKPAPPPFIIGLSCFLVGRKPGISDAELRGMGLGDNVGGRD